MALAIIPLLLCVFELALRLGGYGYSTSFFKPLRVGDREMVVENDKFGLRFFPPALARSPAPVVMKAHKDPRTCRIFVLGESAALGDPRPAYGAARYLQALLEERYPEGSFEVVCVAMTAINSYALLPIAKECAEHEGDLWLVYMGNNEMVGPFGATSVLGPQTPSRTLVRLSLAFQKLRLGQLLAAAGRRLRGEAAQQQPWGGMEMFNRTRVSPSDRHRERVYDNFRANLEGILRAGLNSGAKVVLSTVAVNLRDCPPFASVPGERLAPGDKETADKLLKEAIAAAQDTNYIRAAECLAQANSLDPQRADIEFNFARCLLALTNFPAARQHYERARDLDALPFRTDSRENETIIELARKYASRGLTFFDAGVYYGGRNAAGIPGRESFYEHVHFNFDGNYALGVAWAELSSRLLPAAMLNRAAGTNWASQERCERRLALTDWNRAAVFEDMIQRLNQPPFTGQFNSGERIRALQAQLAELRQRMTPEAAAAARKLYQEALQRGPQDHRLHENYAEFLERTGDLPGATAEWDTVRQLIPHHHLAWYQVGHLLLRQARLPEARRWLSRAVELRPDLSEGWLELGQIDALEGKPAQALVKYQRAGSLLPQDPRPWYHSGKALSALRRQAEAIADLRKAVQLGPGYWEARYALGEELAFSGSYRQAGEQFAEVLRLKPDYPMAHLNLGVALVREGQFTDALQHFEATRRLDPQNRLAADYLQKVQAALTNAELRAALTNNATR